MLTIVEGILADETASHKVIDRNRCAIEVPVDRNGIEIGQADKILEVCHRKIVGTRKLTARSRGRFGNRSSMEAAVPPEVNP